MLKKLIILIMVMTGFLSCEQNNNVLVTYYVTDSDSGFEINYRNENGDLVNQQVDTQSEADVWTYDYIAEKGDIVFMSLIYYDINSKVKAQIRMDGKVFKQGSSKHDTTSYLVVSGTVPF